MENLQKYLEYLKDNIETPYIVTGIEDIALDDPRDYPDRSSAEYNALKKLHNRLKDEYQKNFD